MNQTPTIPYRFAFGPVRPSTDPSQPYVHQTVPFILSIELPIIGTDPDSLCRSVAMSLKALCRPQAVAQIAEQLQAHLFQSSIKPDLNHIPAGVSPAEPSTGQEPTMPKITLGAPTIDQPIPADTRDPEVEITPAGTKLNFESQLSDQADLPNLDPLSPNDPLNKDAPQ